MRTNQPRACPQHSTPAFDCIGKECRYYNDDGSCGYAALLLVAGKLADALYVPLKAVIAAIEQALPVFNLYLQERCPCYTCPDCEIGETVTELWCKRLGVWVDPTDGLPCQEPETTPESKGGEHID